MNAVCNTSPIISLLLLGRLGLIREVMGTIVIPGAVRNELYAKGYIKPDEANKFEEFAAAGIINIYHVKDVEPELRMNTGIHRGELEVLAAARELGIKTVILDDNAARIEAHRLGFEVTGTLGILTAAKDIRLIERVGPFMDALRANGRYISESIYKHVLKINDELEVK